MTVKPTQTEQQELSIRIARMRQLEADLDQAIADVTRHRKELERMKREVVHLNDQISAQLKR